MKSFLSLALLPLAVIAADISSDSTADYASSAKCRCLPGDACWPSNSAWAKLNTTVSGALIKTVPIGSPCHDPTYDEAACAALQDSWTLVETQ